MDYLATYDIADPRRLRRIARLMQEFGVRVQKSVFECQLTDGDLLHLKEEAETLMDPDTDGVRFYPLLANARNKQTILGLGAVADFPRAYIA